MTQQEAHVERRRHKKNSSASTSSAASSLASASASASAPSAAAPVKSIPDQDVDMTPSNGANQGKKIKKKKLKQNKVQAAPASSASASVSASTSDETSTTPDIQANASQTNESVAAQSSTPASNIIKKKKNKNKNKNITKPDEHDSTQNGHESTTVSTEEISHSNGSSAMDVDASSSSQQTMTPKPASKKSKSPATPSSQNLKDQQPKSTKKQSKAKQVKSQNDSNGTGNIAEGESADELLIEAAPVDHEASLYTQSIVLAGGRTSVESVPVVFSSDSKYFMTCLGSHIKMHSVATGELVLKMANGEGKNDSEMIAIALNPRNKFQLYSASLDGSICLWDITDGSLLNTWDLRSPITKFVVDPTGSSIGYVCFKACNRGIQKITRIHRTLSANGSIRMAPITALKPQQGSCTGLIAVDGVQLVIGCSDAFLVFDLESKETYRFKTRNSIVTMALHPTDSALAVGLVNGEICLYYCLSQPSNPRPVITTLHWHAHRVSSITFTADGVYMLSVGQESVLVIWQLENGHLQFLPRLGGPLSSVSICPDQTLFAVGLFENAVKLISSVDLTFRCCVVGVQRDCAVQDVVYHDNGEIDNIVGFNSSVVVDPRSGMVVMPGAPGFIQFYNVMEDRNVLEVETVQQNRVSKREEEDGEPALARVVKVAFSEDDGGEWMVTVDERDGEVELDIQLKFWAWDSVQQSYVVNTRVSAPHTKRITSLTFVPAIPADHDTPASPLLLISTSLDGTFKTWQLHSKPGTDPYWSPHSHSSYKSTPITSSSIARDASLIALSHGPLISLWEPRSTTLISVLTYPPSTSTIHSLVFSDAAPYLVAATSTTVIVWNLLTASVWWSGVVGGTISQLYLRGSEILVVSEEDATIKDQAETKNMTSRVSVFDIMSPVPVAVHVVKGRIMDGAILNRPWRSTGNHKDILSSFVYINEMSEFMGLSVNSNETATSVGGGKDETKPAVVEAAVQGGKKGGLLSGIYGRKVVAAPKEIPVSQVAVVGKGAGDDDIDALTLSERLKKLSFMNAASHILPPPSKFISVFFDAMLEKRLAKSESSNAEEKEKIEQNNGVEMNEDNEMMDIQNERTEALQRPTLESDVGSFTFLKSAFEDIIKDSQTNTKKQPKA